MQGVGSLEVARQATLPPAATGRHRAQRPLQGASDVAHPARHVGVGNGQLVPEVLHGDGGGGKGGGVTAV